jgi:hypothetical protein
MSSSRVPNWLQWGHRFICLLIVLGICGSTIPLPNGQRAEKDLSEPFPCQHRACGCQSATQCWKTCCCFTNAQKVAWAEQHRIKLPKFVLVAAAREATQHELCSKSCCKKAARAPGAPTPDAPKTASVKVVEPAGAQYVIAVLVEECQGNGWSWKSLPWAIVSAPSFTLGYTSDVVTKFELVSDSSATLKISPPVPPPRRETALFNAV